MAETLGSLCDKLTIVKLKEWHSEKQPERMHSQTTQEDQLREKIDAFIADAASGRIPVERLTFAANKVYRKEGNAVPEVTGSIGAVFSHLAEVNCSLWLIRADESHRPRGAISPRFLCKAWQRTSTHAADPLHPCTL